MLKFFFISWLFLICFLCLNQSTDALNKAYCKCRSKVSSRIVGGKVAVRNAFPWQISLGLLPDTPWEIKPDVYKVGKRENLPVHFKVATHICGGAVLSESLVLTAAHCVTDDKLNLKPAEKFGVGSGNKHNLIDIYNHGRMPIESIYVHPNYNVSSKDTVHDVAIIKLAQPLNFRSESIRPACLLLENLGGLTKDYHELISTGWGSINVMSFNYITRKWDGYEASLQLKEALFKDVSSNSKICKENKKLICVDSMHNNESVCKGDSGGPLHFILDGYTFVVGVTSFGSTSHLGSFKIQACNGEAGFTRLQSSLEWIRSIAGDDLCLFEEVQNDQIRLSQSNLIKSSDV